MFTVEGAVPIHALRDVAAPSEAARPTGDAMFGRILEDAVQSTNNQLQRAEAATEAFAAGQSNDIHGTMIAVSTADIQLRALGSVRNKVMDAFYELWRMSV